MNATELKVILDQHKLWIESGRKKGKRANLRGVYLQGANLRGVYRQSANLQSANLQSADLRDANLQSANLQSADLRDADLQSADLRGANLKGANLKDANLRGVNLQDADLQSAYLWGATFDLNFKKVGYFAYATFSEDQVAWVCLHPKFHKWASTLKWVKAEAAAA